jgi:two-component system phosphate regulon response regulator PhoB
VTAQILIVEDEPAIRELLALNLRHAGFDPLQAADAASARRQIDAALPDLLLLDWMLPDQSGVDLARALRADSRTREMPIIMLTARSAESDKLGGFDAGADDYVTKPFSPRELVARVRALLRRRAPEASDDPVEVAGLRLEPETFRVIAGGQALRMGPTEFRLLHYLMKNLDRVLSRGKLLDGVWGDHVFIEERTVDVHIGRLRKALSRGAPGFDPIRTVRSAGYALEVDRRKVGAD